VGTDDTVIAAASMTQVMGATGEMINGFDVKDFREYIDQVRKDSSVAERKSQDRRAVGRGDPLPG
jgi:hypothetical protein